jgi:hypothetical protein
MSAELKSGARGQFIGVIAMSVGLGWLLAAAFVMWLRGESFVWWVLLAVLFVLVITKLSMAVYKRIA